MQTIELLAPARDYETAVAAIDAGADAVYMAVPVSVPASRPETRSMIFAARRSMPTVSAHGFT